MSDQPFDPPAPSSGPGPSTPPPAAPPPPATIGGLVRDPYTKLGGVASGLAHHFGLDVSLIRIAFVLFTVVSGIGLPLYLAAWLIMPRAQYWPPIGAPGRVQRSLAGREIALGLVAVGGLLLLFVGGGQITAVLVPLALVAAGVWLLLQPDADAAISSVRSSVRSTLGADEPVAGPQGGAQPVGGPQPQDTPGWSPWAAPAEASRSPYGSSPTTGRPPGTPVPARRRRFRFLLFLPLLLLAIPVIALIALVSSGEITIGDDASVSFVPLAVENIPPEISSGTADLELDLTNLTPAMFDTEDPVEVKIDQGLGEVNVLVPDGLVVDVTASTGVGDLQIFESSSDGIAPEISIPADEPHLVLEIVVGVGAVTVEFAD